MFFLLSKFLNWLVYPAPLLFVGLLAILVFYGDATRAGAFACLLLLFYSLSAPIYVRPLVRWLEGPRPGRRHSPHYDVAIVLTGMVLMSAAVAQDVLSSNESVERILEGISLVKAGHR